MLRHFTFEFETVFVPPCNGRGGMLRGRAVLEGAGSKNRADGVGLNFKLFWGISAAMGNDPLSAGNGECGWIEVGGNSRSPPNLMKYF